jgi:hypothetical protein
MSAEDAKTWAGRKARFSRAAARFGDQECSAPAYEGDRLSAEAFVPDELLAPWDGVFFELRRE